MIIKFSHISRLSIALACAMLAAVPASARNATPNPKGEAELSKLLAGRVAGTPTDCIDQHLTEDSQVIDHTAIVYREGSTLWVNRPVGGLDALDYNSILVTRSFISQLCSVDPVHLVDRTSRFERGFLSLGKFVPYTKPR